MSLTETVFLHTSKSICTELRRCTESYLHISFVKHYKRIRRDILSSWVKISLDAAGTDTMQFNPHSTRAGSTTAARGNPVSFQETLNTAALLWPHFLVFMIHVSLSFMTSNSSTQVLLMLVLWNNLLLSVRDDMVLNLCTVCCGVWLHVSVALKSYLSHKPLVTTYLKIKRDFTTDKAQQVPRL